MVELGAQAGAAAETVSGAVSGGLTDGLAASELESLQRDRLALGAMAERREEFYRSVLESLSEGVIITDAESRILFANRRMAELTGWSVSELVGSISYELLAPPELWPAMRRRLQERLEGQEEVYENELLRKDGVRHWILVRASPYRGADGRILGTIGALSCMQRVKELEEEKDRLLGAMQAEREFPDIVGESPALHRVLEQIRMVSATEASVLILGESGTGKELVARAIHEAGPRKSRALVRVNCASIPKDLFESEFFGHVKGAFTGAVKDRVGRFEMADGGTLFLDEVGEIPPDLQAKLLRVLQEGTFERVGDERTRKVNVRIVAATNRELLDEAKAGRFRMDLYYRLAVFPIQLPPLRDRVEDVRPLAEHFVAQAGRRLGGRRLRIGAAEWTRLERYGWPGNVRELQNVIERAAILARNGELRFDGLFPAVGERGRSAGRGAEVMSKESAGAAEALSLGDLKAREREVVRAALEASGGRIYGPDGAAAALGVPPTTLSSKLRRWGWRGRVGVGSLRTTQAQATGAGADGPTKSEV